MSRKASSGAPVLIVYVVTMLICFVIFGSAGVFLLDKFVTQPKEQLEQDRNEVTTAPVEEYDYSQFRRTFLFVNAQGETVNGIVLLRVIPDNLTVKVVPISPCTLASVGSASGTIASLYEAGGMTYLTKAVEDATGIEAEKYLKIDNEGFARLVEYFGGTSTYVFPSDLYYKDEATGEMTSFSHGPASRTLWGDDLRRIVNYPLYEQGGKDRLSVLGEISVSLINSACYQNNKNVNANLQNIFNTIFNYSDTDITSKDFKEARKAYEYLTEDPIQPATYRLPQGEWNADFTKFDILDSFKDDIKLFFELVEPQQ